MMVSPTRFGVLRAAILLACALTPALCHAVEQTPLRIPRVSRAPKLSDFIDGTPREAEAVIKTFWQFDPHDGEPVSLPTTAYLSYDDKNLYVGWICKDDPKKIYARVAPRKQIDLDDRVTINIDTFQDHKHAYWFDVNPYGIQYDGRTTDGIGDDASWEGLWYSEGKITEDGYVVLEAIPFKTLRFPRANKQIWYICLARAIQRNNEFSIWPFVSHAKLPQFVGQFAPIEIDDNISPGRNFQMIPYGIYSHDRYLDPALGSQLDNERQVGLDAKAVLHDALTLDVALNPDFSEIGSDDPKVQVNQRYEVVYPERRPFFLENASIFSTPEQLFFSRRIVNPQYGVKLTGSLGRWGLGAIAADDRAPGQIIAKGEPGHGDRATDGVFRIEREFAQQSHVGLFLSGTKFRDTSNRVGSIDARYITRHNWSLIGQATTTQTDAGADGYTAGPGYALRIRKSDNHTTFQTRYTDRSAGMNPTLGYISRTDIRQGDGYWSYQWKPPAGHKVMSWGPSLYGNTVYDHNGTLQNWLAEPGFAVSMPRLTFLNVYFDRGYEFYQGQKFEEQSISFFAQSSWFKWMDLNTSYSVGTQPNYYPAQGTQPFLANSANASADLVLHPTSHLRMEQIYYYTRLATRPESLPAGLPSGVIFTNHLIRSRVNYQFTRDYSFRAILDYNTLLPNNALVSSTYSKQADTTLLFTYLPHPGTAFHLGYSDAYQNVEYEGPGAREFRLTNLPGTNTDRQVFVKFSYLLRF